MSNLIPDEVLRPENDRALKLHNNEAEPWVLLEDGTRCGWTDLARELLACREALRGVLSCDGHVFAPGEYECLLTDAICYGENEQSNALRAALAMARACLPEYKEADDAE